MARVTVEDCLGRGIINRFSLVHVASKRSRELIRGAKPLYDCNNKEIVTALREIAAHKVVIVKGKEGVH